MRGLPYAGWARVAVRFRRRDALVQHVHSQRDQSDGPIPDDLSESDNLHVVKKEQQPYGDENSGRDWKLGWLAAQRYQAGKLVHGLTELALLGGVIGFERHVEN